MRIAAAQAPTPIPRERAGERGRSAPESEIPPVDNSSSPVPAPGQEKGWPRIIAATVLVIAALATLAYLTAVVTGRIPKDDRLSLADLSLAIVGCLFLVLIIHPAALDRLNLVKLPGGIELTLEKIQRQQVEQRRELDAFFSILSNLLSFPEKYHLRSLARTDEEYTGQPSLRDELHRLKRFGLIDEVEGQKIGDMFDGKKFMLRSFVRLTSQGERFIKALDKIEA
jgi:hypothetical protein